MRGALLAAFIFSSTVWAQDFAADVRQKVDHFQQRYGIPLIYRDIPPRPGLHFESVSPQEDQRLDAYLRIFEEEISKYPAEFFRDREVRGIALVTHLFAQDKPAQGLYNPASRVMFFDISRFSDNESLKRHSIHHELFHMMALQTPGYVIEERAWSGLNRKDFHYGEQKRTWREVNPYNQGAPYLPGFATDYAMMSVEEDKAEVFACLMQQKHRKLLDRWSQKDAILRQKVEMIKAFVARYCPSMNEAYWNQMSLSVGG